VVKTSIGLWVAMMLLMLSATVFAESGVAQGPPVEAAQGVPAPAPKPVAVKQAPKILSAAGGVGGATGLASETPPAAGGVSGGAAAAELQVNVLPLPAVAASGGTAAVMHESHDNKDTASGQEPGHESGLVSFARTTGVLVCGVAALLLLSVLAVLTWALGRTVLAGGKFQITSHWGGFGGGMGGWRISRGAFLLIATLFTAIAAGFLSDQAIQLAAPAAAAAQVGSGAASSEPSARAAPPVSFTPAPPAK
jgi:hypothetical protein